MKRLLHERHVCGNQDKDVEISFLCTMCQIKYKWNTFKIWRKSLHGQQPNVSPPVETSHQLSFSPTYIYICVCDIMYLSCIWKWGLEDKGSIKDLNKSQRREGKGLTRVARKLRKGRMGLLLWRHHRKLDQFVAVSADRNHTFAVFFFSCRRITFRFFGREY